jgi:hypothetical protein
MVDVPYQMVLSTLQTVGLLVGIAYYLIIMRNSQRAQRLQLETRQAQMFMQIYNQAQDPVQRKAGNRIRYLEWSSFEELVALFDPENPENEENFLAMNALIAYYEGVGVLVREGLLDIRWVALLMAGRTRMLWEKFAPYAGEIRRIAEQPRWASEWEYLYDELMKYMDDHPELKT